MRSYRVELHSHCQGDAVDKLSHTIYEHIDQAKKVGLDAIAVTWHRRICQDEDAAAYARERGMLLISGMEAEIKGAHLIVLGLHEGDLPPQTTWDEVRAMRRRNPGIVVIAPHPFYPHPSCLGRALNGNADCIDAVEWCSLHVHWLPHRINPNIRAARWAHRHEKPLLACSDSHSTSAIGRNPSTVQAEELTERAILDAVRAGRIHFRRHSLDMGSFLYRGTEVLVGQRRQLARWALSHIAGRKPAW